MGKTCLAKCIIIMEKIEAETNSDIINLTDLTRYIRLNAGMSKLTVDSYLKHFKELGFIKAVDLMKFKLNFEEVKKYK